MNFLDVISVIGWVVAVIQLFQLGVVVFKAFHTYSKGKRTITPGDLENQRQSDAENGEREDCRTPNVRDISSPMPESQEAILVKPRHSTEDVHDSLLRPRGRVTFEIMIQPTLGAYEGNQGQIAPLISRCSPSVLDLTYFLDLS